jgi:uncharacterized OB-fold protein
MAERRPDRILGPGHDQFWEWCQRDELRLQRCTLCGKLRWPIVSSCSYCGQQQFVWERMSGIGRVVSWCTFERDYYQGVLPLPWATILVELQEGPLFLSNPRGFSWQDISSGMAVKVSFIDCEDAAGSFRLPVFERT